MSTKSKFFSRDLSWLKFNYRVLMEARDPAVPLYERIKFMAIFSSNLDEFFRVRVASWRRIQRIKKKKIKQGIEYKPKKLLAAIFKEVDQQQEEYGNIWRKQILPELREKNVIIYDRKQPLKVHALEIKRYFLSQVLAFMQPVILSGETVETPFLENGELYFALRLESKSQKDHKIHYAHLNIPPTVPRFLRLSDYRKKHYIIYLDDIIKMNLAYIFPDYRVVGCYAIKLNRDADLDISDEYSGDLVQKIRKQIKKRQIGVPSRFLYDQAMPVDLRDFLSQTYKLSEDDLIPGGRYHNLSDLMELPNPVGEELEYPPMPPLYKSRLDREDRFLPGISKRDRMLHFPYQSYDYVLRFFNEAAIDPQVKMIKATLYRVASDSLIVNALISAAKNGKDVTVFVEVKARFDEANNLRWADKMEEAGVRLVYSLPGLKVHAKVAMVKRDEGNKSVTYGYFGTGNFHEGTATLYCDHGLFTANESLTSELESIFIFLEKQQPISSLNHLLVAKHNLQERLLELIDREIEMAHQNRKAKIIIKLNNVEDRVMIEKLYEASEAGVEIIMIVRAICCVIPQAPFSQNITVIRIVDRFLEHARIYYFHNGGDDQLFLASADWMRRNLYRRIEVGFPIYDEEVKEQIMKFLEVQLADNTKAHKLDRHHHHTPVQKPGPKVRAQTAIYDWLLSRGNQP